MRRFVAKGPPAGVIRVGSLMQAGPAPGQAVALRADATVSEIAAQLVAQPGPFGVDAERVPELLRQIGERQLGFEGFHLFAGSQNLRAVNSIDQALGSAVAQKLVLEEMMDGVRTLRISGNAFRIEDY